MTQFFPFEQLSPAQLAAIASRGYGPNGADKFEYGFGSHGECLSRRVNKALAPKVAAADGSNRADFTLRTERDGEVREVKPFATKAPPVAAVELPKAESFAQDGERVVEMLITLLRESPTQPRKKYPLASMEEMAASVKEHGIIQPLIVRKRLGFALGSDTDDCLEIVAGHRRKRAAVMVGLATVPVIIRALSDQDAIEHQLIENLQRVDLDPIEEAEGLQKMLAIEDEGKPRYTRASLAGKLGKTEQHILDCLRLLRLPPRAVEAIQNDLIGPSIGYHIAKLPSMAMRRQLTEETLRGHGDGGGPLSAREVVDLIRRNYVKVLRDVPFDMEDATLVPAKTEAGERVSGGDCKTCPLNSLNMPEGAKEKFGFCTLPTCFMAKTEAHVSKAKERALAAGALVITGAEGARLLEHDGTPRHDSGMVDLRAKPHPGEVVSLKDSKTWGEMVNGNATEEIVVSRTAAGEAVKGKVTGQVKVRPTVVIDDKGQEHWLVERKVAIEAAKKNGFESVFSGNGNGKGLRPSGKKQTAVEVQRKKDEEAKKKLATMMGIVGAELLSVEISKHGMKPGAWAALLEVALFHSGNDALAYFCQRREIDAGEDAQKAIRAYARKIAPTEGGAARMPALVIELLLAGWMKLAGVESAGYKALATVYGLELGAVKAAAKERVGTKPAPKPKPGKEEPPVRELIAQLAPKHGLRTLSEINALAQKACGKDYDALQGRELIALLEAIKELPLAGGKDKRTSVATKKWSGKPTKKGNK